MSQKPVLVLVLALSLSSGLLPAAAFAAEGRFVVEASAQPPSRGEWKPGGTDAVDSVFPTPATYWTGYVHFSAGVYSKQNPLVYFVGSADNGWAKFDLSAIPDGATITAASLRFYCFNLYSNDPTVDIRLMTGDPVADTSAFSLWNQILGGTLVGDTVTVDNIGFVSRSLNAAGVAAVQSRLTQNWIAFGIHEIHPTPVYGGRAWGWNSNSPYKPVLFITYDIPIDICGVEAGTHSYPLVMGESDTLRARFANTGASTAVGTRVYATVGASKFDSLTIASMPPGCDTTLYFHLTTPPGMDSRQYYSFVAYNAGDNNHANDTARFDDWSFPPGTYSAEGFDFASGFPPTGWVVVNHDGGLVSWTLASGTSAHTGQNLARCVYETSLRNDDWLITPPAALPSGFLDSLGLFYRSYSSSPADTLEVWVMRGQTVQDTLTRLLRAPVGTQTYQQARLSLESFAGSTVCIGVRKAGTSLNQLYLDDIWWMRRSGDDVGVARIVAPPDTVVEGTLIAPRVLIRNYGVHGTTFGVRLIVQQSASIVYDTAETGIVLAAGDSVVWTFTKPWLAGPRAGFNLTAYTQMSGDGNRSNDTTRSICAVVSPTMGGWAERAPMPLPPSGKDVKDGGWLSYMMANGTIYAGKGNKTGDFYSFDRAANSWAELMTIPTGNEGKLPYTGTAACTDDAGHVYMVKGNNTLGFWRYDVPGDSWRQFPDVPPGPYNKKVKTGADILYVQRGGNSVVYLLKGQKTEFYAFYPGSNQWVPLPDAPNGATKWYKGSFLTYDGDHTVYAHKGKYHELWTFDISTNAWNPTPKTGMPFIGRAGRRKKAQDGSSGAWSAGSLFALKGGNTQEFWVYLPARDTWFELDTIPAFGSSGKKKKVKGGGDLTAADDGLYALKGNKCRELWEYAVLDDAPRAVARRDGVAALDLAAVGGGQLRILPNPVQGDFAYLTAEKTPLPRLGTVRLYDAAGRSVLHSSFVIHGSPFALDLRGLCAGVYLARLSSEGRTTTQKLVIQRQ